MKKLLIIIILLLIPVHALSQTKEKAQNIFLKELNNILQNSDQQHWKYSGKMSIDSAFSINEKGNLVATVRYKTDSSFVRTKMEAPINKAKAVGYDLYLILEYVKDDVIISESARNSNELVNKFRSNLFHIGIPLQNGYKEQEKLQYLLKQLLKFY